MILPILSRGRSSNPLNSPKTVCPLYFPSFHPPEPQYNDGSLWLVVLNLGVAAIALHGLFNNVEAEAGVACVTMYKALFKDLFLYLIGDTCPVVGNPNLAQVSFFACGYCYSVGLSVVDGIPYDVVYDGIQGLIRPLPGPCL